MMFLPENTYLLMVSLAEEQKIVFCPIEKEYKNMCLSLGGVFIPKGHEITDEIKSRIRNGEVSILIIER